MSGDRERESDMSLLAQSGCSEKQVATTDNHQADPFLCTTKLASVRCYVTLGTISKHQGVQHAIAVFQIVPHQGYRALYRELAIL